MNPSSSSLSAGFAGQVAIVTGGGGAIGGAIARALAAAGARIAIWDIAEESARARVEEIDSAGGTAVAIVCDVTDRDAVERAAGETVGAFGRLDILVNAAGGSRKEATTSAELPFFDITTEGLQSTMALNCTGTVIPCQVVGRIFAGQQRGVILNLASVAGLRPLTRAVGYSTAKAAVVSFTQWLAVHMAKEYSPRIRVNALAPGFVVTDQNRFLLVDEKTGAPTARGRQVIAQVPMGRYGQPEEMVGAALWLVSDAASYVTGSIVTIDGGFLAASGV